MKPALKHALLAELYIIGISSLLFYAPHYIEMGEEDTVWAPITMLSLLVLSASVMAYLFCYLPIREYLDGNKEQAVTLFLSTVGYFALITLVMMVTMFVIQ